ncbi:MAG: sulfotransferase [Magnetococcales bacterium]|nr:sulfotransferase [Magnetococcales bacterium]
MSQPPIFIHIGMAKAASTFLQRACFPSWPVDDHHFNEKDLELLVAESLDVDFFRQRFQHLTPGPRGTTLFTNELLSGSPPNVQQIYPYDPQQIARRLQHIYPSAKVLLIIREQRSIILSTYAFRTINKGFNSEPLAQFIATHREKMGDYYGYDRLIRSYGDLFGGENLLVLPYEWLSGDRERFLNRMQAFMGISAPFPEEGERVNPSDKSRGYIDLCRMLNRPLFQLFKLSGRNRNFGRRLHRFKQGPLQKLVGVMPPATRKPWQLDDGELGELHRLFGESNRRTEQLTGLDLKALGYLWE